ncbi:hypothetical protein HK096_004915 [Nowakowskiella sp. JEL0078]|nr:hypothetical protein HK096_004915 [Nowakowskiella sp. JEL0078]
MAFSPPNSPLSSNSLLSLSPGAFSPVSPVSPVSPGSDYERRISFSSFDNSPSHDDHDMRLTFKDKLIRSKQKTPSVSTLTSFDEFDQLQSQKSAANNLSVFGLGFNFSNSSGGSLKLCAEPDSDTASVDERDAMRLGKITGYQNVDEMTSFPFRRLSNFSSASGSVSIDHEERKSNVSSNVSQDEESRTELEIRYQRLLTMPSRVAQRRQSQNEIFNPDENDTFDDTNQVKTVKEKLSGVKIKETLDSDNLESDSSEVRNGIDLQNRPTIKGDNVKVEIDQYISKLVSTAAKLFGSNSTVLGDQSASQPTDSFKEKVRNKRLSFVSLSSKGTFDKIRAPSWFTGEPGISIEGEEAGPAHYGKSKLPKKKKGWIYGINDEESDISDEDTRSVLTNSTESDKGTTIDHREEDEEVSFGVPGELFSKRRSSESILINTDTASSSTAVGNDSDSQCTSFSHHATRAHLLSLSPSKSGLPVPIDSVSLNSVDTNSLTFGINSVDTNSLTSPKKMRQKSKPPMTLASNQSVNSLVSISDIQSNVSFSLSRNVITPDFYNLGLHIAVSDPTISHDKLENFTSYTITIKLLRPNVQGFNNDTVCTLTVNRRYSEFRHFYLSIMKKYLAIQDWPELPKKSIFDRFNKKTIDDRTQAFSTIMSFIALHPVLHRCPEILEFLGFVASYGKPARFFNARKQVSEDIPRDSLHRLSRIPSRISPKTRLLDSEKRHNRRMSTPI